MDITFDFEVWNQPVYKYSFQYFNPNNRSSRGSLNDSIIKLSDYKDDPYKKHRSREAKYIIGIALEVFYGVEVKPRHQESDGPEYDNLNSAFYLYDLELDEDYNIIGGEWFSRNHPDFIWTADYNSKALTPADYYLLSRSLWSGKSGLSYDIKKLALKTAKSGSPLAYIVNSLIKLSQQEKK